WNSADWSASNDTVRGGKSESYLDINASFSAAKFRGTLDIKTLGGAGFASQRTSGDERSWDLSKYDGVELKIKKADSMKYTFTIKDELLPRNPENGREQSTTSYEFDFSFDSRVLKDGDDAIFIPWSDLKATYRGKPKPDAPELDLKNIKRFSILFSTSFFGDQEGPFTLSIKSIAAVKR
ncbi:NADH:ubiquinone oxidoreductase complex I intermediate-associated protein 30, partial [Rhizodiscina lignyota]